MKVVAETLLLVGVDLVDREEQRLAGADQLAGQFNVRRCHLGAAVHHHDDGVGFLERHFGLAKDFGRDEVFVLRKNAAGVDDAQAASAPFGFAVETVARDARFVADDGAPRAHQAIEERGFAHVGAPHDGDSGNAGGNRRRIQNWLGHNNFRTVWGRHSCLPILLLPLLLFLSQPEIKFKGVGQERPTHTRAY